MVYGDWRDSSCGSSERYPLLMPAAEVKEMKPQLLSGNRVFLGTVDEVRSDQAKIDTGDGQPRYIPMNMRKEGVAGTQKRRCGRITVNDQNLLRVQPSCCRARATRRTDRNQARKGDDPFCGGVEQSHLVRPVARSKVASIPVWANVIFLLDESDTIVEVTM